MKKRWMRLMAAGLCVTVLAGCTLDEKDVDIAPQNSAGAVQKTEEEGLELDGIAALQSKYEDDEGYRYTDPQYNLSKDHEFEFQLGDACMEKMEDDFSLQDEAIRVFADGSLQDEIVVTKRLNEAEQTYTIAPLEGSAFDYDLDQETHDARKKERDAYEDEIEDSETDWVDETEENDTEEKTERNYDEEDLTEDIEESENDIKDQPQGDEYEEEETVQVTEEKEGGAESQEANWGSRSKFWMVRYMDLETGEMLEKPEITVFTTREDLSATTLTQSIGEGGNYTLSWKPVEGADYYEVYRLSYGTAWREVKTTDTACSLQEFESQKELDENLPQLSEGRTYKGEKKESFDLDYIPNAMMNHALEEDATYFVVAKTDDGKRSAMSNECSPQVMLNQLPYCNADEMETDFEGESVLDMPTYLPVQMKDGSVKNYVVDYRTAAVRDYDLADDGEKEIEFRVRCKNLDMGFETMTMKGISAEDFERELQQLIERQEKQTTKSSRVDENIDVPYVPEEVDDEPSEEAEDEPSKEPSKERKDEPSEEPSKEVEDEPSEKPSKEVEDEPSEEPGKEEPSETPSTGTDPLHLPVELENRLYANSALSEWLARNLLVHNEKISLEGFPEAGDSEWLEEAFMEAYRQNPLTGIFANAKYDYASNSMIVEYVQTKEENDTMQQECLKKAKEIVAEVIEDDMTDYEKEAAINQYLCEHGTYNYDVLNYQRDDGWIDNSALDECSNSFTPYGILVEGVGVCESYSEAFRVVAEEAGLEVIQTFGTLNGGAHEWNRVKLDDSWYTMDVTNNDNEMMPNALFNLSDEMAKEVLAENQTNLLSAVRDQFTASDDKYEYYKMSDLYTEDAEKAAEQLAEQMQSKDSASIRMDSSLGGADIEEIIQKALQKSGVERVKFNQMAGVIGMLKD